MIAGFLSLRVRPMSIKAKILSLVAAFALMASAITAMGLATMADYHRVIDSYTRASNNAFRAERLNMLIANSSIEMRNIYVSKTPDDLSKRFDRLTAFIDETQAMMAEWKSDLKPGEVPEFDHMNDGANSVDAYGRKVMSIARTDGVTAAQAFGMNAKSIAGREYFQAQLEKIVAHIQGQMTQRQADLNTYQTQRAIEFFAVAGSGIILLLLASLSIAIGSIANPLKRVSQSVIRISEGAYDTAIPAEKANGDEISRLWQAIGVLKDRAIELKRINESKLELHLD